jgi:hypothetical protein
MGVTEAAVTSAPFAATKMPYSTVFSNAAVIKGFSIATGLFKLKVVFNFFSDSSWILAKLTSNSFEGFSFL